MEEGDFETNNEKGKLSYIIGFEGNLQAAAYDASIDRVAVSPLSILPMYVTTFCASFHLFVSLDEPTMAMLLIC